MKVARTIAELGGLLDGPRRAGKTIGFVPTMGAFHEGHLSLMRLARNGCDVVVVSLFVNPTQFNESSDLAAYPRDEARDLEMAAGAGVDVLFAPTPDEMYPDGFASRVVVTGVTEVLEGLERGPAHFYGVATVVLKLLNIVAPAVAYFGAKDAQQVVVVQRMVRDLNVQVRVEVGPTVREADGLAMSSRNQRLDASHRHQALALRGGLDAARAAIGRGETSGDRVEAAGRAAMQALGVTPEYLAVRSADSLAVVSPLAGRMLIAVAARVGDVRLIDNDLVDIP